MNIYRIDHLHQRVVNPNLNLNLNLNLILIPEPSNIQE
jgi:hypothetical protein